MNELKLDLHTHPFEALGYPKVELASVWQICNEVKRKGLDGIAITEHNSPSLSFRAREIANREGMGVIIIPGQERIIARYHIVELYMFGRRIRILAHPFEAPPDQANIDAVEIASVRGRFDSPVIMDYVKRKGLFTVSNSDAHYLQEIGFHSNWVNPLDLFRVKPLEKLLEGKEMPKIKGVIFDLDGTLIDTLETYIQAFNRGIGRFNLEPITKEKLAAFLNRDLGLENILLELFPSLFEEREARLQCFEEIRSAYLELEKENVLLKPGVDEVLPLLKGMGIKIGIVTGRTTSGQDKWIELSRLGIDSFIDAMVTGAEAERKPSPEGLLKCARELGLSLEDCVMIGDSQADIITGRAAGVVTLAIASGVAREELLSKEHPTAIINSLTELSSLFAGSA